MWAIGTTRERLLAAALWLMALAVVAARKYNTAGGRLADHPLNVHIVCHTHDDAGWLKTVDQYYWGANNSIQLAGVQYILDSVVESLAANPNRKFIYGEMAFFQRWWAQQDDDTRALVTRLVESGQLDFVNGGYVQHDEATSHYVAMIDQTTRGHAFLRDTFGKAPTVGWQIDPFGHSSTQAGLLSAQVGFDALFFGRADYQDMDYRRKVKALEMVWRGSSSLEDADVFTGNFPSGNYGPPWGFDFNWGSWDAPIMDDPRLAEYNVEERVESFVQRCREIANVTVGNDIMLVFGSDFQYAAAQITFKNIDKLIHYANADGRLNVFYSTPAAYVAAKHGYGAEWPLKTDDFFPYADCPHCYWTGYFTSRPTSKGLVRSATSFLQAARQLEAFVGLNTSGATTDALEEAVALTQHHDAVTGTAKQHVACDYAARLHKGLVEAQEVVTNALSSLIRGREGPGGLAARRGWAAAGAASAASLASEERRTAPGGGASVAEQRRRLAEAAPERQAPPNPIDAPVDLSFCNWLNVSACRPTVALSEAGQGILVAAYNPLAWSRQAPLRVPVSTVRACTWRVTGPEGEAVPAQLVPVGAATAALQHLLVSINATSPASLADAELVFIADLLPLGYSTFFLEPIPGSCGEASSRASSAAASQPSRMSRAGPPGGQSEAPLLRLHGAAAPPAAATQNTGRALEQQEAKRKKKEKTVVLDNGEVALEFDKERGLLTSMRTTSGVAIDFATRFGWYNSSDGLNQEENKGQAAGAYISRPNGFFSVSGERPVLLEIVQGDVVSEARQVFSEWATLVTRLYKGQSQVEVEWTVGPIPFEDGLGREVVLSYETDIDSGAEFWTDSNGREMLRRVRDARPAWKLNVTELVAGNYYPLTAAMHIQDTKRQLALLTERAQGGASLRAGQMEVMVHRRTLADDWRGVAEPINETACGCTQCGCAGLVTRGVHWLVLEAREEAARPRRTAQQLLNDPPLVAYGAIPRHVGSSGAATDGGGGIVGLRRQFSLSEGHILHSSAHLLTLKETGVQSFLVRLAHLYQEGEDPALARPIVENLNAVLQLFEYREVRELSLSANQLRSEVRRQRFKAGTALDGGGGSGARRGRALALAGEESQGAAVLCTRGCADGELLVTLRPMEVRTFELVYRPE